MKLFISIVLLCILPAILCNPPTTIRPHQRRGRTTTLSSVKNNEAGSNHPSGSHSGGGARRRTTARRHSTESTNAASAVALGLPEILLTVFDCLSVEDLPNARDVCKDWRAIVDTNTLPERVQRLSLTRIPKNSPLTWQNFVSIYNTIAPQKNFWEIQYKRQFPRGLQQSENVPNSFHLRWKIIPVDEISEIPNGSPKPNNYIKRSFVSVSWIESQVLDLVELGLPGAYLDMMKPKIEIRAWAQHRALPLIFQDNNAPWEVKIFLLNDRRETIHSEVITFVNNPAYADKWEEKILTLESYGVGLRRIRINSDLLPMKGGTDIFIPKPERRVRGAGRSTRHHARKNAA